MKTSTIHLPAIVAGALVLGSAAFTFTTTSAGAAPAPAAAPSGLVLLAEDLTSNRFNGLPNNRLQVTMSYDGNPGALSLRFQCYDSVTHTVCWERIDGEYGTGNPLSSFGTKIHTFEYDLNGFEPTGLVKVDGVDPNGAVDGLCFGLFWRNAGGEFHMLKGADFDAASNSGCDFWGAWPIRMNDADFAAVTSHISDANARGQAESMLWGARMLANGTYNLKPLIGLR